MSYLDLVKQARARLAEASSAPGSHAADTSADEINELNEFIPPRALAASQVPPRPLVLRSTYRRWFTLTVAEADGTTVDPAESEALYQQIMRLTDDAGPLWADALFADELRRFHADTARCGLCGGLGHGQGQDD